MIDINELRQSLGAVTPEEIAELLDRLEAAEKEIESWKGLAQQFGNEADALRAKVAEMEQQEPVAFVLNAPKLKRCAALLDAGKKLPHKTRLYAQAGAQAQPAPSVPDGWKLVPIEPTEKMINEGTCASTLPGPRYIDSACAKQCWTNMLAAAPEAKP